MCGLAAVFGLSKFPARPTIKYANNTHFTPSNQSQYLEKDFTKLMYLAAMRGEDSTGITLTMLDGKEPVTYKDTIPSFTCLCTKRYEKVIKDAKWEVAIGHARAATQGGLSHTAAHPHTVGPITLSHNGTVTNIRTYLPEVPVDHVSDSQAIAFALSLVEPEQVDTVLNRLPLFGSLMWYDTRDSSFNVLHDNSRPLYWTKGGKKYKGAHTFGFISSQMLALHWVDHIEGIVVKEVPTMKHFKYVNGEMLCVGQWTTYSPQVVTYTSKWNGNYVANQYASQFDDAWLEADDSAPEKGDRLRVGQLFDSGTNLFSTYTCPLTSKKYRIIVDPPVMESVSTLNSFLNDGGIVEVKYVQDDRIYSRFYSTGKINTNNSAAC